MLFGKTDSCLGERGSERSSVLLKLNIDSPLRKVESFYFFFSYHDIQESRCALTKPDKCPGSSTNRPEKLNMSCFNCEIIYFNPTAQGRKKKRSVFILIFKQKAHPELYDKGKNADFMGILLNLAISLGTLKMSVQK